MSGGDDELEEEHEEHVNHEAWVIPYADLLTLLMAMFIALFAMSTVDVSKFKKLSLGFNEALGGGKLDSGIGGAGKATSPVVGQGNGQGVLSGTNLLTGSEGVSGEQLQKALLAASQQMHDQAKQQQTLQQVKQSIDNAAKSLGLGGQVQTKALNNGLEVTVLTDKVLFPNGSATLEPASHDLLNLLASVIGALDNQIIVQGNTDSAPIHSAQFPSNRYLSSARADAVVEYFIGRGLASQRLTSAGRGADYPIASNATPEGRARNRRVEIIVQSKLVKTTLDDAGIDDKPAPTPTTEPSIAPTPGTMDPGVKPSLPAP